MKVVSKMGTVIFIDKMKLHHVLYVRQLKCNVYYVSKLTIENNYLVIFSYKLCVMQDKTLRTVSGVGEQCDGYIISRHKHKQITLISWMILSCGIVVLVIRPIRQFLFFLELVSRNRVDELCTICLRSKQTREFFSNILNESVDLFGLIHCDV